MLPHIVTLKKRTMSKCFDFSFHHWRIACNRSHDFCWAWECCKYKI